MTKVGIFVNVVNFIAVKVLVICDYWSYKKVEGGKYHVNLEKKCYSDVDFNFV